MTSQQELECVERVLAGDKSAFEVILGEYETRVFRLAYRFTGSQASAEDLTQEIFIAVYRSLPSFKRRSALGTWVYRIAMNHCVEYRRKRRLEVLPLCEEIAEDTSGAGNPVRSAERAETADQVREAMRTLSGMHREVVVLHELQGLTYEETADLLGVPVGTVKSRLFNAMRRMREHLSQSSAERTAV